MDEGAPVAYEVLESGIPVIARDEVEVGTVRHVVAASKQDIFHGIVIATPSDGERFVLAEHIASLHERGVDLAIEASAVAELPPPSGSEPVFHAIDPGPPRGWQHWSGLGYGLGPRRYMGPPPSRARWDREG
jgi:hypothetical protein